MSGHPASVSLEVGRAGWRPPRDIGFRPPPLRRVVAIAGIIFWCGFPIYWTINTSFLTTANAESQPAHYVPVPFDAQNFAQLFGVTRQAVAFGGTVGGLAISYLNTMIECSWATAMTIALAVLGAYAFARLTFPLKRIIFYTALATLTLPSYAVLIPLYSLFTQIGLVNTYLGIVLVDTAAFLPFAMWILFSAFEAIPRELEEAAEIDGASHLRRIYAVVLPLARAGLVSATIIVFLMAWGNFLLPLVLSANNATEPLTVWITSLIGQHIIPYTLLCAAGVLCILVPAIIVATLSRHIISGLLTGRGR